MKKQSPTRFAASLILLLAFSAGCGEGDDDDDDMVTATNTVAPNRTATPTTTIASIPTATPTQSNELDIAVCAPEAGPFSAEINHPFFPMPVGSQWILTGDDDGTPVRVEITSLPDTEVVAGVTTRVIEERESEDDELVEVSRNYFAQAPDGTLCYYGEDVDDYEDGVIVGHGGAWRAGVSGALPGILIPANPRVGQRFKQEVAVGVAEDQAEQVAAGESVEVGLGTFTDTIRYEESSPLDSGTSEKIYARGVGLLVDDAIERIATSLAGAGIIPTSAPR